MIVAFGEQVRSPPPPIYFEEHFSINKIVNMNSHQMPLLYGLWSAGAIRKVMHAGFATRGVIQQNALVFSVESGQKLSTVVPH
jgi:hypothetical protein